MSERLRFAVGQSSLGAFIGAMSEAGLVVFEFGDNEADLLQLLATRFPEASLERDGGGLRDVLQRLERVADHPDEKVDITLDPRGNSYQKRVWALLQEIPAGDTTTYGALAAKLGTREAQVHEVNLK